MSFQILFLLILLIGAPAVLLASLWGKREATRFDWLVKTLYSLVFLGYVLVVGRWDWLSLHLRWLWLALYAVVIVLSYRRVRSAPFFADSGPSQTFKRGAGNVFTLAVFLAFFLFSARGYFTAEPAAEMVFPLREGRYYIAHGGSSPLINYHNRHPVQKYALDIIAVSAGGWRAAGLYPSDVERYVIYDQPVYAPCAGTVTVTVDGLSDLVPPEMDPSNPAGNHLVLACGQADVLLAHLRPGSLRVGQGDLVQAGDWLANVGNSGNSSEPHLHIHATSPGSGGVFEGQGIPMRFDGRFLARNALVKN